MKILVGCEFSGVVRDAFAARGHDAWSCDLLPSDAGGQHHQGDLLQYLDDTKGEWDMGIFHPSCTRLSNSGVRWLHVPPPGKTKEQMWEDMRLAALFYTALRNAKIPKIAIENPIMHCYARELIRPARRQIVQPWWFGDPSFKATGLELINLPDLIPTNKLTPPKKGTLEHRAWSKVHMASPGPNRWKIRSKTPEPVGRAMAEQWG